MTIFHDAANNLFSRSVGHIPQSWEGFITWEADACWNCGGDMLVERRNPIGTFAFKTCPVCGGEGEIQTSDQGYERELTWFANPSIYQIRYLNGDCNLWEL